MSTPLLLCALPLDAQSSTQASVDMTIHIAGPRARVFDAVTTPRFWPLWHPATLTVSGATERPVQQGDTICECARIGTQVRNGIWTVVECTPPVRVVLRTASGRTQVSYVLTARGAVTEFRRTLLYHPEDFVTDDADVLTVQAIMRQQSVQALQRLQQFIEHMMAAQEPEACSLHRNLW